MTTDDTFLRAAKYETDDENDVLISRSTWSLKLSGLIAGVLLVIGRSASYGNITWSPAYHQASTPLMVIVSTKAPTNPLPAIPKTSPLADPAAISKRSAASEVITFSPGKNAEGGSGGDDGDQESSNTAGSGNGSHVAAGSDAGGTGQTPGQGTNGSHGSDAEADLSRPVARDSALACRIVEGDPVPRQLFHRM